MRLVYIDESGRDDRYYFFGALIADAAAVRSVERGLDEVAALVARHVATFDRGAEFHAVDMFHGRGAWADVPLVWRVKACDLVAKVLARSSALFIFRGVDLRALRASYSSPYPAHLLTLAHTLEDVHMRLDGFDHDSLGLILADEHHAANDSRRSLRHFKLARVPGYTRRPLRRIADTIYYGPSHASRMLQAADVATYFLNRDRTIVESDPRSSKAVAKIAANVRSITVSEFVWSPRRKTQRPARRGVG